MKVVNLNLPIRRGVVSGVVVIGEEVALYWLGVTTTTGDRFSHLEHAFGAIPVWEQPRGLELDTF